MRMIQRIAETVQLLLIAALVFGVPVLVGAGPRGGQYSFFQKYLAAPLAGTAVIVLLSLVNFGVARVCAKIDARERREQTSEPAA